MLSKTNSLHYRHTLISFMAVLLAFSLIADALLVAQQRGELLNEARTYASRELRLLGEWVKTADREDLSGLRQSLLAWAEDNPGLVALQALGADGALVRYRRDPPAEYSFEVTHKVQRPDGSSVDLTLERDITRIERVIGGVRLQLVAGSTVFILILGGFLWFTVRRMALLPMRRYETELQMHRYRLERLVQERTSELTATNRNLQKEVGERQQTEDKLRRSTERLKVLRDIDQAILAARSLDEIAGAALGHISELMPCTRATVSLFDFARAEARLLAVHADEPTRLRPGERLAIDVNAIPRSLRTGQPYVVEDLGTIEKLSPMEQILAEEGTRAYALVPIAYRGELLGALHLSSSTKGICGAETLDVGADVADVLALAIQQIRLNEQVQRHATELERRVAERTGELRDAQAELEAFTYSISHDLRGHLWTVQGFSDFLREKYGGRLDEEGLDYINSIADAARSMSVLIQDLLTYSHLNRAEMQPVPVSIDRAANEAVSSLEKMIAEHEAEVAIESPLGEAQGHHATLVQVLTNLISNAVTYVAPGVTPRVRLYSDQSDESVRIWVEDNGVGIPESQRERIFRVFERLHPDQAYPGTGIGLAIVQRGMSRMGGRVGLEPGDDGGSRFWIELPL